MPVILAYIHNMRTRTLPAGAATDGLAAYEQQREATLSNAPAVVAGRKERVFSFGPFTLRYEEEESVDFSALARAASAQVDRVRRFNFADALQTENTRADLASAPMGGNDHVFAAGGRFAGVINDLTARAADALHNLTYGADGRICNAQIYFPPGGRPDQAAAPYAAEASAPSTPTVRAREALTAYLAAGRPAPQTGRLVSGRV